MHQTARTCSLDPISRVSSLGVARPKGRVNALEGFATKRSKRVSLYKVEVVRAVGRILAHLDLPPFLSSSSLHLIHLVHTLSLS